MLFLVGLYLIFGTEHPIAGLLVLMAALAMNN